MYLSHTLEKAFDNINWNEKIIVYNLFKNQIVMMGVKQEVREWKLEKRSHEQIKEELTLGR